MSPKRKLVIAFLLFVLTVAIRVPVLRSVGETWDEYTVVNPGETYISATRNLDFSEGPWIQNYEHPPVAKYLYGLSREIPKHLFFVREWDKEYHPDKEYTVPRLLSATFGGLTVVLVFLIGSLLFSSAVGVVSALILTVIPHFIAYTGVASLESAFIFFTTLFVYCLVRALKSNRWTYHLLTVVVLTLSFATRYNGLFFVFFYAAVMIFKYRSALLHLRLNKIPWPVLLSPIIFLGLFYALWPWLWRSPIHLLDSVLRSAGGHTGEYFLGSLAQPDWLYYPLYFLVTTPEVLLVLLFLFLVRLVKGGIKSSVSLFILGWFLTPFLATFSDFKQDGIRYVIAFIPALSLIVGYMAIWIFGYLKFRLLKIVFVAVVTIGLLYPLMLFFPYYLDYYNLASGGPKQAYDNKTFEVGWWGEGGPAAVRYINQHAPRSGVVRINFAPAHVLIKFRNDLRLEQNYVPGNHDDFILVNTYNERYGDTLMLADLDKYQLVYEVTTPVWDLFKAPLVKVYKRL
jgi:predicted membrane-bound dolichyl-phosphate-mannose-protein mannosyltransferase